MPPRFPLGRTTEFSGLSATFQNANAGKIGARKRTRTSTPLRELAPEASASANSAIRAQVLEYEAFSLCPPLWSLSTRAGKGRFWGPQKHRVNKGQDAEYPNPLYKFHEYRGLEI